MSALNPVLVALTLLWLLACIVAAAKVLRLRATGQFFHEHSYYLATIWMLAMAPCAWLLIPLLAGEASFWTGGVQLLIGLMVFGAGRNARRQRLNPETTSSMNYHEKSALLMLLALTLVSFRFAMPVWQADTGEIFGVFGGAVFLLVTILVIGHIVLAIFHAHVEAEIDTPEDERDRAVALFSMRNAYYLMVFTLWTVPVIAMLGFDGLLVAKLALAILLAGEFCYYGSRIAYYRLGVS